ncbi:linear amide C-N hydrolase [Methanobrevibacter sp.]
MFSNYASIDEVKKDISDFNITDESYSKKLSNTPLHWLVADRGGESLVVEQTRDGQDVYENPVGVLTNNPVFSMQLSNLENYSNLSPRQPPAAHDGQYSWGMGSIDLPCDLSSMGRFARAVWMKNNIKTINGSYSDV